MIVSWPITFWLEKCLDIILGEQGKTRYQNQDLKALIEMHTYEAIKRISEEEKIIIFLKKIFRNLQILLGYLPKKKIL